MDFWWISKNVDILSKNGLYWRQKNVIFSNIFQMIYMKLAQSMSNWCIIRYSKFRVDICNGFGVTAKIREGVRFCPPPPNGARVNIHKFRLLHIVLLFVSGAFVSWNSWGHWTRWHPCGRPRVIRIGAFQSKCWNRQPSSSMERDRTR